MICPTCNREVPCDSRGQMARHKIAKKSKIVCIMSGSKGTPARKKRRAKRPAAPRICPTHGIALVGRSTSYGKRYGCPISGCTVVAWSGSTSTPADDQTRAARMRAHEAFDPLWQQAGWKRSRMYEHLSEFMGIEGKDCHIGMFNIEQCEKVIEFCRTFRLSAAPSA